MRLSGGQKQRVAIARAVIMNPRWRPAERLGRVLVEFPIRCGSGCCVASRRRQLGQDAKRGQGSENSCVHTCRACYRHGPLAPHETPGSCCWTRPPARSMPRARWGRQRAACQRTPASFEPGACAAPQARNLQKGSGLRGKRRRSEQPPFPRVAAPPPAAPGARGAGACRE